jgi:hypothetical protein
VVDIKVDMHELRNHVAVKHSSDTFLSFKLKMNELKKISDEQKNKHCSKLFKERG